MECIAAAAAQSIVRSVEIDPAINIDQRKRDVQGGNADRGISARKHLRTGWKLPLTAAVISPRLDLILGKDEVGRESRKLQIISCLVPQVDLHRRRREHFCNKYRSFCRQCLTLCPAVIDYDVGVANRAGPDV